MAQYNSKSRYLICLVMLLLPLLLWTGCDNAKDSPYSDDSGEPAPSPMGFDNSNSDDDDDDDNNDNDDNDDDDNDDDTDEGLLDNDLMRVRIDIDTGHIIEITDLTKDVPVPLLDQTLAGDTVHYPFFIRNYDLTVCAPEYPPEISPCENRLDDCLQVTWGCGEAMTLVARIELLDDRPAVRFYSGAYDSETPNIYSIAYPILGALMPLSDTPENDTLAIPYEGGLLLSDPLNKIREDTLATQSILAQMQYPYAHSMMLQMISYQSKTVGGFLIYTRDPYFTVKKFQLYDNDPQGDLPEDFLAIQHFNWDVFDVDETGGMILDYPVEVAAMPTGDWEDGADIYRQWGADQMWAEDPVALREPTDRALFETAAASIFGLSARQDQTAWIRAFHQQICGGVDGARLLFVPGWDFHPNGEMEGQEILAFMQAGWDEQYWLPYQGAFVDNYNAMKTDLGDFVYPFFYDLLLHDGFPGWDGWTGTVGESGDLGAPWLDLQIIAPGGGPGGFARQFPGFEGSTHTFCPANQTSHDFYIWRNNLLKDSTQGADHLVMDGTYHDISVTILGQYCYADNHDHSYQGSGRWLTQSVRDIHDELIGDNAQRAFSIGIENSTEVFWDQLDFYHLGDVGLGPIKNPSDTSDPDNPVFKGINKWVMGGQAFEIPLTSFVYHPYGSMRTGGKIQCSTDFGDVFYWIAASEYLWGGILELIYFNTPVDILPGIESGDVDCPGGFPCAFQTGWGSGEGWNYGWYYDDMIHDSDPDKLAFLNKAAYLRVVAATDYLATGIMQKPPELSPPAPMVDYDYNLYAHIMGPDYYHHGDYTAPALIIQAWQTWEGDGVALFLANPTDESRDASFSLDIGDYDLDEADLVLVDVELPIGADQDLATCVSGVVCPVSLTVLPRSFAMIELR